MLRLLASLIATLGILLILYHNVNVAYSLNYQEHLFINSDNDTIYVSEGSFLISLNTSSGKIIKNMSTEDYGPFTIDPLTSILYGSSGENLSIINLANSKKIAEGISIPNNGFSMSFDSASNLLYMVDDETLVDFGIFNASNRSVEAYNTSGIAYKVESDPKSSRAYILDNERDKIRVFDPGVRQIISNISIIPDAYDILMDPVNDILYVSTRDASRVGIIDTARNEVIKYLVTGDYNDYGETESSLAIDPFGRTLYISDYADRKIVKINLRNNTEVNTIIPDVPPSELIFDKKQGDLYVLDTESKSLLKITNDGKQEILFGHKVPIPIKSKQDNSDIAKISTRRDASDMDSTSPWEKIYIANPELKSIFVINTNSNSISNQLRFEHEPTLVTVFPIRNHLLVSFEDLSGLYRIDPEGNKTLQNYKIPSPKLVVADEDKIYTANNSNLTATLYIIEDEKVNRITLPSEKLNHMAINHDTNKAYISERLFSIVDITMNETKELPYETIGNPQDVVVNPKTNLVYVLGDQPENSSSEIVVRPLDSYKELNSLYVLDGLSDSVMDIVKFDARLNSVGLNTRTNQVYVTGNNGSGLESGGFLFTLDGNTNRVISNVSFRTKPDLLVINEDTNMVYILDSVTGSIYTFDGTIRDLVPAVSTLNFETIPHDSGDIYCDGKRVNDLRVTYAYNEQIDCHAKAPSNFVFSSWRGYSTKTDNMTTLRVIKDGTLVAEFSQIPSLLNLPNIAYSITIIGGILGMLKYLLPKLRLRHRDDKKLS